MVMPPVTLIHHSARRGHRHPPNSIAGLEYCLAAGARIIEVDISPLADGEFALLHGPRLESGAAGSGLISEHVAEKELCQRQFGPTGRPTDADLSELLLTANHPHAIVSWSVHTCARCSDCSRAGV